MKIEDLEKKIKQKEIGYLYLLYGEERFLLESCLKKIKSLFGEILKGINYIEIDESNIHEIISELETPSFFRKLLNAFNLSLIAKWPLQVSAFYSKKAQLFIYIYKIFSKGVKILIF